MLNMVTMLQFVYCVRQHIEYPAVTLYTSSLVLQRLPLRHHRAHELMYTPDRAYFYGRKIFLFNTVFFFHSLSLRVRRRVM